MSTMLAAPLQLVAAISRGMRAAFQDGTGGRVMNSEQLWREMMSAGQMTESGALVTDDNVMTVGEIFACLRILSSSIAMLPLNLVEMGDGGREEIARDHPVQGLLSRGPNSRQTPFDFVQMSILHKLLYGNFYAVVTRSAGRVIEIWPLNPRRVHVEELPDGTLVYKYTTPKGEPVTFFEEEMLHVHGMTTDGIVGISTVAAAREDAGLGMRMRTFAGALFKNGLRPSGVYKVPTFLSEEKFREAKSMLDSYMSGAENAAKTLLLQGGAEWAKVSLDAEEAQMIEGRQFTRSQVAMFFGVPPQFLGDLAGSTTWGSGMAQQGKGFVSLVLNPHIIALCQELDKALLSPDERDRYYHRIDTHLLTEGDAESKAKVNDIYVKNGVLNPNEVRAGLGLNPRDGGDAYVDPSKSGAAPAKPGATDKPKDAAVA
jgi:HK97 family phage portal protein